MTNDWDSALPSGGLITVTIYASIRDQNGYLLLADKQGRFVDNKSQLRHEVLRLVQRYWAEATHDDVHWAVDPEHWDGDGEIWWTTCAEVDGFVRYGGCELFN